MANEEKPVRGPGRKFVKKDKAAEATSGDTSASSAASPGFEGGGFVWAMAHVLRGKTVRRRSWVGAKSPLGPRDPGKRRHRSQRLASRLTSPH